MGITAAAGSEQRQVSHLGPRRQTVGLYSPAFPGQWWGLDQQPGLDPVPRWGCWCCRQQLSTWSVMWRWVEAVHVRLHGCVPVHGRVRPPTQLSRWCWRALPRAGAETLHSSRVSGLMREHVSGYMYAFVSVSAYMCLGVLVRALGACVLSGVHTCVVVCWCVCVCWARAVCWTRTWFFEGCHLLQSKVGIMGASLISGEVSPAAVAVFERLSQLSPLLMHCPDGRRGRDGQSAV